MRHGCQRTAADGPDPPPTPHLHPTPYLQSEVEKSLPPKTEMKLFIGMSPVQKQLYKSILNKDAAALNAMGGPDRSRLLNTLMQLRKVSEYRRFGGRGARGAWLAGATLWRRAGGVASC